MPDWDAEVVIDEALVRALLSEQFPELDAASARLLGEGWDNAVWVVEETWAFRFPRRQIAIPGVRRELAVLPRLGPLVQVPIPVPVFVGQQSERFPWPFFGTRLLPGDEVAEAELDDEARVTLGLELARFLRELHTPDMRARVDPDDGLPVDPLGRADMDKRVPMARKYLGELESTGAWTLDPSAERVLGHASRLAPRERVFVHGDLHLRHVLVEKGSLTGVIDWGDCCTGDPSIDLHVAWSMLPPAGREAFFEEYGAVDEDIESRARVLAVGLCSMLAIYAHSVGNANLLRESVAGLERTLVDA
jgi:aminoglycoside phosphotransferase (APT) family kinase protein